jgi:hypothetical protein
MMMRNDERRADRSCGIVWDLVSKEQRQMAADKCDLQWIEETMN